MNYFEHHQNHGIVGSPIDVLTSEETSDTNVDDHMEGGGGRWEFLLINITRNDIFYLFPT